MLFVKKHFSKMRVGVLFLHAPFFPVIARSELAHDVAISFFLRARRGNILALFFFAKKKRSAKEKTTAYV